MWDLPSANYRDSLASSSSLASFSTSTPLGYSNYKKRSHRVKHHDPRRSKHLPSREIGHRLRADGNAEKEEEYGGECLLSVGQQSEQCGYRGSTK